MAVMVMVIEFVEGKKVGCLFSFSAVVVQQADLSL
jgi:hypothetical protein